MLILIGGVPGAGKTTLAHALASDPGQIIELDALMPDFNKLVAKVDYATMLPVWFAKRRHLVPSFRDYQIESETYWSSIRQIIDSELNNSQSQTRIVEGAQFSPSRLRDWLDELDEARRDLVRIIFMTQQDLPLANQFAQDAKKSGFRVWDRSNELKLIREL